nr:MFS transporter [Clostridia bacterium]
MMKRYRSLIGCMLITLIHTGINSVATAAMPYLREYYHCELSTIIAGASSCSFAMFFAGLLGSKVITGLKPKGAFYLSSFFAAAYPFMILISDQVWTFILGCAFIGLTAAWGSHATSNIYIHRFHEEHAAFFIASISTSGMFGGALFQFLSGKLLSVYGLRGLYLTMIFMAFLATIFNAVFVENIEAQESDVQKRSLDSSSSLIKDDTFIRMGIVVLLSGSLCASFSTLLVTMLLKNGYTTQASTTYLSLHTLLSGTMALLSGMIADKKGYRFYMTYLYAIYFAAIAFAITYDHFPSGTLLILMIASFAAASPLASIYIMLCKPIFKERSLSAHTLLLSIGSIGSAVVLPFYTRLYESKGFTFLWVSLSVVAVLCFIILDNVIRNKNKEA